MDMRSGGRAGAMREDGAERPQDRHADEHAVDADAVCGGAADVSWHAIVAMSCPVPACPTSRVSPVPAALPAGSQL